MRSIYNDDFIFSLLRTRVKDQYQEISETSFNVTTASSVSNLDLLVSNLDLLKLSTYDEAHKQ